MKKLCLPVTVYLLEEPASFEGTGKDMYQALFVKLMKLPPETLVYCGHEYTLSNYRFALSIDSENTDLVKANERAVKLRESNTPTVPSTIEQELRTNPFLRADSEVIRRRFPEALDTVALLTAVREAKNNF